MSYLESESQSDHSSRHATPKMHDQMLLPTFIDGSDYGQVIQVLLSLTETCSQCLGKKMHFCMQQFCEEQAVFCLKCHKHRHTLHRINELYLAFVDRNTIPTRSGQAINLLTKLINELTLKKTNAEKLMLELVITQEKLVETIAKYEEIRENVVRETQLDKLYECMSQGLKVYRSQVHNWTEESEQPKWKKISQNFQKNLKNTKFYYKQKLENCLNLFEVGFYIEEYEKGIEIAMDKQEAKLLKDNSGNCARGTWAKNTEKKRKKMFNLDLISLFEQTHLSQYVEAKWHFIPIQISMARAATLPDSELMVHRPHRIILTECNYKSLFVQKFISSSTTIKEFKWSGEWSEMMMPRNATFLSLSMNIKFKPHFPSNLKKLHLRLKGGRGQYGRLFRLNRSIDSEPPEDCVSLYDLIFSLEKLRELVLCKGNWSPDEIKMIAERARNSELSSMVLYNCDNSRQLIVENMLPAVGTLGVLRKQWRRAMLQGLMLHRNSRLNNLHCRQRLLEAAMVGKCDLNQSMVSEMNSSEPIRLRTNTGHAENEHSGLEWLMNLQQQ